MNVTIAMGTNANMTPTRLRFHTSAVNISPQKPNDLVNSDGWKMIHPASLTGVKSMMPKHSAQI